MTALHYAAAHGHLPSVNALIHSGASLHIQTNGSYYRCAFWGGRRGRWCGRGSPVPPPFARRYTALHWAAYNGHADATAALLGAGADAAIEDFYFIGCAAQRSAAQRRSAQPTATAAVAALVGRRQGNAHKRMGRAAHMRRRWSRRAAALLAIVSLPHAGMGLRSLLTHYARAHHGFAHSDCTVGCALWHPRVHL